jgi:aspartyl aminopeptidase
VNKPLLWIPTLIIHLYRWRNFNLNKETELFPIDSLAAAELNKSCSTDKVESKEGDKDEEFKPLEAITERHDPKVQDTIAAESGVNTSAIVDFKHMLYNT